MKKIIAKLTCLIKGHNWHIPKPIVAKGYMECTRCGKGFISRYFK